MAYNKAKEEYKWKVWKEQEEKKLRELGVSEEVIAELRDYDWNCFKRELKMLPESGKFNSLLTCKTS